MNDYPKYAIITPVKDEENYIDLTIESVIRQTIHPLQWVIVDDGSKDNTKTIIETYSRRYDWIKGVYAGDNGPRKPGVRHIKAFYEGYAHLDKSGWEFLAKLDGDVSFDKNYFEKCFSYFKENPRLGVGGGMILNQVNGAWVPEKHPLFHVRGATKIYRRECWDAIGGLVVATCYDTIDEVKANMLGYETRSFPDLKVLHHRYTGGSYGKWRNAVKNGLSDYMAGYHPLFLVAKCVKRIVEKPYSTDCFGLLYGFLLGYTRKEKQVNDPALIKYLRQQQLRRLMLKESIWR